MNDFNFTSAGSIFVAVVAVLLNFTGKKAYKDNATYLTTTNHDLREQNATLKEEKIELSNQLVKAQTESIQKDETIKQLKPFSAVVTTMSNNHKQVMTSLTDVTKLITEKFDGKH